MDNLKSLIIHRGGSLEPFICANGDKYDSSARLQAGYNLIYLSDKWNTDHTEGYKGGILAKGAYYGIVAPRAKDGKMVVKVFHGTAEQVVKVQTDAYLTEPMLTLPSEIPNPNHGGRAIIQYVQIHAGGVSWDFSHGCLTALNSGGFNEFDKFMSLLRLNEKLHIILL